MNIPPGLDTRSPGLIAAAIAVAIVALLSAPLGRSTLWDRDEPRFARATVEMVRSGQFLYPTFNGEPRTQKPALIYWLMALSVSVLGPTERAVRLWSPVGVAAAALFTFAIGRRFLSGRGALVAMAVMAFSPLALVEGSLATTDAVLLAAITGAMAAFVSLACRPSTGATIWLATSLAVALLTKGPVGLAVPLAVMGACLALEWPAARIPVIQRIGVAAIAGIALFVAWLVPASLATSGAFVSEGIWRESIVRALTPMEGHGGSLLVYLPYYPLVIVAGFAPWVIALPVALRRVGQGTEGDALRILLLTWTLVPLALFTVAATKLPHYILPVWPALGLAVGAVADAAFDRRLSDDDHVWLGRVATTYGIVVIAALLGMLAATPVIPLEMLRMPLVALAVSGIAVVAVAVLAVRRRRPLRGGAWLLTGMVCWPLLIGLWLVPALESVKPIPEVARQISARASPDVEVVAYGVDDPSLDFYLDRWTIRRLTSDDEVQVWSREPKMGLLVTRRALLDRISGSSGTSLARIGGASGLDYTRGRRLELVIASRIAASPTGMTEPGAR